MTIKEYQDYFHSIINQEITSNPSNKENHLMYTKLNLSRFNRWLKLGEIHLENKKTILAISEPQEWIIISEPWCGDAAHSVPFIIKLASYNPLINVQFQLRDSENSEIESYLTNGTKSIPILIARKNGMDIFRWGPRPIPCQSFIEEFKKSNPTFDQLKEYTQKWYNKNKGIHIQNEICSLLNLA